MTATDEMRRMLDERGVEYTEDHGYREFFWEFGERGRARACAIGTKGFMQVLLTGITPAQAIDATLGRHTTTRCGKYRTKYGRSIPVCECCGYGIGDMRWNYCPSCGARVVSE